MATAGHVDARSEGHIQGVGFHYLQGCTRSVPVLCTHLMFCELTIRLRRVVRILVLSSNESQNDSTLFYNYVCIYQPLTGTLIWLQSWDLHKLFSSSKLCPYSAAQNLMHQAKTQVVGYPYTFETH